MTAWEPSPLMLWAWRIACYAVLAALVFVLAGCTRDQVRECPTTPVVVEVPVPVRTPVPAELSVSPDLRMCKPTGGIVGELVGEIRENAAAACAELVKCDARAKELRDGEPTD